MDEILDQEPIEPTYKPERPLLITILCVLMALGVALAIPRIFQNEFEMIGVWYRPYLMISCLITLTSMVGLWMMKKWGIYLYTTLAVINQGIMIAMGFWSFYPLIIVSVLIILLFTQYHKME
jgi:hypothetical protein